MSLLLRKLGLIGFIVSLTACAGIKDIVSKPDTPLLYSHSSSDFEVAWNTLQTGNDAVIDGRITNLKDIKINVIDLRVTVPSADGKSVSEGAVLLERMNLRMNNSVSFSVKLKNVKIAKGNVLEFNMNYNSAAGGWGGREAQSSFKVDAATGAAIGE